MSTPTVDAYKIFNLDEFIATGLVSKVYTVALAGVGEKEILVTSGNQIGMVYEDTFLAIEAAGHNPFYFNGYAIMVDPNRDVWLGIEVDED